MDESNKKMIGGFSYHVTDEQVEEYSKLPPEERLRWLEEAQEFIFKALSKEKWELLQKFRRGDI